MLNELLRPTQAGHYKANATRRTASLVQKSPYSLQEVTTVDEKPPNEQLFDFSPLKQHVVTDESLTDPDRFFNAAEGNPPNFAILEEKPLHRIIVYLKAQGLSNVEISKRTGYTQPWVSQVTRQPWFRLRLTQELREAGADAISTLLKANALDSVYTLVELRDDQDAPKAVRKAAADSLLDRYLGKPTQKVETEEKRPPSTEELHKLNREIEQLDKQLKDEN